ncbi:MAG: type II and III secretion system protein family protein [Novosphingobium sp.]
MNRRLFHSLLTAACAVAPLSFAPMAASQATAQSVTRPAGDLALSVGRGQLVTMPGTISDIFIADDKIADVQIKSGRQLYIFGRGGGVTTVYASNAAGAIVWSSTVRVGSNIDSVDQMLRIAMPDAKISVATMGSNTVLLTGTVGAPEDAAEAQRLVTAFVGTGSNVISRLKTATPLQVNLQVRIAEVSRSLVRDIGVNLQTADSSGGFKFGLGQGRAFSPQWTPGGTLATASAGSAGTTIVLPTSTGSTFAAAGKLFGLDILGALDLGEQIGLVTTLSQPNLTALSGETADFLAGGEFPIPLSQGLGSTTVEYKKYGVSLAYTPTVLANGRISLRVRPEVSELSAQGAVTIGGVQIPALTVRRAETTVELGSGQSFMIAGLLSNNAQNTLKRTPGLADVPILSNLFKSTNFRKGETELVIIVTPYLVNPVNANDIKLPTDGFNTANEIQRLLGNKISDGKTGQDRPKPEMAPDRVSPGPNVGALEGVAPAAPQPAPRASNDEPKRNDRKNRKAGNTGPGFSLN